MRWRLKAEQALMYDKEGVTQLRKLVANVYQRERAWTIMGEEGELDRSTNNVEVRRNVVVTSDDGLRLETSVLRWDADERRLWTDAPVRAVAPRLGRSGHRTRRAHGGRGGDGDGPGAGHLRPGQGEVVMIRAAVILTVGLSLVASDALAQSSRAATAPGRASVAKQTGLPGTGGSRAAAPAVTSRHQAGDDADGKPAERSKDQPVTVDSDKMERFGKEGLVIFTRQRGRAAGQLGAVRRPHGGLPGREGRPDPPDGVDRQRPDHHARTAAPAPPGAPSTTSSSSAWC